MHRHHSTDSPTWGAQLSPVSVHLHCLWYLHVPPRKDQDSAESDTSLTLLRHGSLSFHTFFRGCSTQLFNIQGCIPDPIGQDADHQSINPSRHGHFFRSESDSGANGKSVLGCSVGLRLVEAMNLRIREHGLDGGGSSSHLLFRYRDRWSSTLILNNTIEISTVPVIALTIPRNSNPEWSSIQSHRTLDKIDAIPR